MSAVARLLEYAAGRHVALPAHTTLELIETPKPVAVPGAPAHALGLMAWQGGWLPLLDLDALVHGTRPGGAPRYALVVGWQGAPGEPVRHGAIATQALPQSVAVNDRDACGLPAGSPRWEALAIACFAREGQAVPVLDTGRLFSACHG